MVTSSEMLSAESASASKGQPPMSNFASFPAPGSRSCLRSAREILRTEEMEKEVRLGRGKVARLDLLVVSLKFKL